MDLAAVVKKYLELSGGFNSPLALARLGLPNHEVERLFSAWDEDYQISRFMVLSVENGDPGDAAGPPEFLINGCKHTHVAFRDGIQQLLTPP